MKRGTSVTPGPRPALDCALEERERAWIGPMVKNAHSLHDHEFLRGFVPNDGQGGFAQVVDDASESSGTRACGVGCGLEEDASDESHGCDGGTIDTALPEHQDWLALVLLGGVISQDGLSAPEGLVFGR